MEASVAIQIEVAERLGADEHAENDAWDHYRGQEHELGHV